MHVLGMSLSNQVAKNHIRAHKAVLEQRGEINDTKNSSGRRKVFLDEGHLDCIFLNLNLLCAISYLHNKKRSPSMADCSHPTEKCENPAHARTVCIPGSGKGLGSRLREV